MRAVVLPGFLLAFVMLMATTASAVPASSAVFMAPTVSTLSTASTGTSGLLETTAWTTAEAPENELDRVRLLFEQGKVLHAHMTHELVDSYTGEAQVISGELWISRDKYKIRADHQVVLVDGDISMVYNERQNKLIISEYEPEEDDFAPSRFFSDADELFQVAGITREDGQTEILLRPDDPFEIFTEVFIRLNADLTPNEIRAVDQMENHLNTRFTDAYYMDYSEAVFVLDYPEDAEIIDLRK